ncbi:TonB-dependent receptor [Comamonas koreensis]|uniref:TonB-dependent receptor n=1 Tax=Comamonas koreensis TaxID=160825 RepID=A0AAW4XZE3_9BURK|nr:TonB-dependent receptor [Comamonas koreensis]MCD2166795.1 TonB-dependent receptor [Comamonas koreensis]
MFFASRFALHPVAGAVALLVSFAGAPALAQTQEGAADTAPATAAAAPTASGDTVLPTVTVNASADASAQGLSKAYAGGQVARGGRVGILGTEDIMNTPFSTTAYTQDLIRDQQARSVGDVLQNDASVRVSRGFGNFQESYFVRGFVLGSDSIAYNGLYGLLPRQYVSAELFERVELLRGASGFLNGASPAGDSIGGALNLLPKRASNEPLTRVSVGGSSGAQGYAAADISRRFGPDQATGLRLNVAKRKGDTTIDDEGVDLSVVSLGMDWRSSNLRLSADVGYQSHKLTTPRPNVTLGAAVTQVPSAPDNSRNFAQPWTYSNERDSFGSVRAEYDINSQLTAWVAGGARFGRERNSLASLTLNNGSTGSGTQGRFDNTRADDIFTGEVGLRGKLTTGSIGHSLVLAASAFSDKRKNAFYSQPAAGALATNLYNPVYGAAPPLGTSSNDLDDPAVQARIKLSSLALSDTLSMFDERLLLTLGVRHQTIETQTFAYNTGIAAPKVDKSRTSPMAAVVFKPAGRVSVYANYIEGLTPGEIAPALSSGLPVANAGAALAPYVSKQKEVGLKWDGGDIGAGLAWFTTDKPRVFRNSISGVYGPEGMDRHRGLELNVFGQVTRGLRVLGGVTWLDAKQLADGHNPNAGKRVIGVPRQQGNLGLEWDVPGVRGLTLDGRAVATGSSYANATNTLQVAGWTRFDLGARYLTEIDGRLVTLRARVENAANRNFWASVGSTGYLVLSNPRTFTVSASVDF